MSPGSSSNEARLVGLAALVILAAALRVASGFDELSHTYDAPAHIAAGMEWLDNGSFYLETDHPPLARVATALGPYLAGVRLSDEARAFIETRRRHLLSKDWEAYRALWFTGLEILHADGRYRRNLSLARLGALAFFSLAALLVCRWSRALYDGPTALAATALFVTTPPILAHAGVVATDMALVPTFVLAMICFLRWLERPTRGAAILLGLTWAFAFLAKFSAVLFLVASAGAVSVLWWLDLRRQMRRDATPLSHELRVRAVGLLIAAAVGLLGMWAGYRFSSEPLVQGERPYAALDRVVGEEGLRHDIAYAMVETPLPLTEVANGVLNVRAHNAFGHPTYWRGENTLAAPWYYYLFMFLAKTPLPFLFLVGCGVAALWRASGTGAPAGDWKRWVPLLCAATILVVTIPSRINIGLRHVLPVYPLLAMVAGYGFASLWRRTGSRTLARGALVVLAGWQLHSAVVIHPDYLAYFNELVRSKASHITLDFDWGQDLGRLRRELEARDIDQVALAYHGFADFDAMGFRGQRPLVAYEPTTGWIAISRSRLLNNMSFDPMDFDANPLDAFHWLDAYEPVAVVGTSILLYYVPDSEAP